MYLYANRVTITVTPMNQPMPNAIMTEHTEKTSSPNSQNIDACANDTTM